MAAGGRLKQLLRTRCLHTGESPRQLKGAGEEIDNRRPIPDAEGDQAVLESQVFSKLSDGGTWWAHPLGIAKVRLSRREPVFVHLDSHTELSQGEKYPMSSHALDRILPFAEPGVQVNGVIGLRVAGIDGADLHLRLVNSESHLVIRGIPGTQWRDDLDARWESLQEDGYPPLWESPSQTIHENDDKKAHPGVRGTELDISWLGSGLLRRVALFHTISSAYSTRSWITGDEWIFELDTRHDVRLDHDRLLSRLTDPIWGLPLRIGDHHCSCDDPPLTNARYMRQCTYHLEHTGNQPCGLQFRFRSGPTVYGKNVREELGRLGADTAWLDRILPRVGQYSNGGSGR